MAYFVRERGDILPRLLLVLSQCLVLAWFWPGRGLPLDDAWIHQVVARTFAETGTLGYSPGEHGAAATSYLWAALLAVGFKLPLLEPSCWALALNTVAALATGQLLYSILLRAGPDDVAPAEWLAISFGAALFASNSANVVWFTCSGMEATPFLALSLAAIWSAVGDENRRRGALVSGIAAGALALLRPEAAPLGGLLVAHAWFRKRSRALAPLALPWLASIALYVGTNVVKTGHAMPSTLAGRRWLWFEMSAGLSRSDHALEFLDAWGMRLGSFTFDTSLGVIWIFVALAAYGALRLIRGHGLVALQRDHEPVAHDGARLVFAWALIHTAFYGLLLPTPGHGGRYQPLIPLLFTAALPFGVAFVLRGLSRIVGGRMAKVRFGWFAALGTVPWLLLAWPVAQSLRQANALAVAHIHATELGAGAFLDTLPEGTVASFDIGGTGFASKRRVLDLGGLSDPKIAALLASGRISTWLEEKHVRWLVLPQSYEPALPVIDDFRSRLHLTDNPSLRLDPVRVFETPFEKWRPAIHATWNAAPKQVVYEVTYTHRRGPREAPDSRPTPRSILDPAKLVRARDRLIAEQMFATLAAWNVPIDVQLTPSRPTSAAEPASSLDTGEPPDALPPALDAPLADGPCTIHAGWWGFHVEGCTSVGSSRLLGAMLYEHGGRYLDVGDIGGALRSIPHTVAQARRRQDPEFHPPLAPLMHPTPGGGKRADKLGLLVCLSVLFLTIGVEMAAARRARLFRFASRLAIKVGARLPTAAMIVVATLSAAIGGCQRHDDVAKAVRDGPGAVEIALSNGGHVDATRPSQRSPLIAAAIEGDPEVVALLIERGARLDAVDDDGAGALHVAARRGHHGAVAVLAAAMTACADCQDREARPSRLDQPVGPRQRTALHDAVLAGAVESTRVLLAAGADPTRSDAFGQSALHLAASADPRSAETIASLLLDAGASPAARDARTFTALHAAALSDNAALVGVLSRHTELLEAKTAANETALDVALRYARDRSAEALLQAGATMTQAERWPPLHEAARTDAVSRAANLVAIGADLARRARDQSALDVAIAHGSERVAALLREHAR